MAKARLIGMFNVGQQVLFTTDSKGLGRQDVGTIVKLHRSGRNGSAEIKTGGAMSGLPSKVTRSLRTVHVLTA